MKRQIDQRAKRAASSLALALAAAVIVIERADGADLVVRITHQEVLQGLSTNQKLMFVDARESDEWAEERLPSAIQLPLRAVNSEKLQRIPKDAILVPYCIKDFRGYEVARALRRAGYTVRIMDDPGLQGWKGAKLPTAGTLPKQTDTQAMQALQARARL